MPLNVSNNNIGNLFNSSLKDYHDELFIKELESQISWLKEQANTSVVPITKRQARIFQGDFYGLLTSIVVDPRLWYATMRCSGLTSPTANTDLLDKIIIPDLEDVTSLMSRHKRND